MGSPPCRPRVRPELQPRGCEHSALAGMCQKAPLASPKERPPQPATFTKPQHERQDEALLTCCTMSLLPQHRNTHTHTYPLKGKSLTCILSLDNVVQKFEDTAYIGRPHCKRTG